MKRKNLLTNASLILLQCLLSTALFAQTSPLPKQWDKRFGGSYIDWLTCLQQTADGGYILGGMPSSIYDDDDFWIIKIDADGIQQWEKRYGGSGEEDLQSVQQTTDGGFILGGYSYNYNNQGYSYWIVKTDVNGVKQWDKTFGGNSDDLLYSVKQTSEGGYILGGYSFSDISGDKTQASRGNADYWVIKIDPNGVKQWDKTFGGNDLDKLYSLWQTNDGGYMLGGQSKSPVGADKTEASRGGNDYWVLKIDANGIKEWDKTFGGDDYDELTSLQQTNDNGYILGGFSYSGISGDKTQRNKGAGDNFITDDYWILKLNANGVKQWDKTFGGGSMDDLQAIQQTIDGGYILGGTSESGTTGDVTQVNRGGGDYWIVKVDANGNKEWDERFGGEINDALYALQQTSDGGYVMGGYSISEKSYDNTQESLGEWDFWVVKLGCPPSAKVESMGSTDICKTGSVILEVDATTGVDLKYQWYKDGKKIEDHANFRRYVATEPGRYRAKVGTGPECGNVSKVITVTNSCGKVSSNLSVSPNPSRGIVTVTYNSTTAGNVQLNVFDKTGKVMFTKTEQAIKGSNTYQLNLSNLINGIYNLQITNSSERNQVKIIIEK